MKGEITILFIIAMLFTALGYMGGKYEANKDFCKQKGGMFVDSPDGWICIKGEKI